LAVCGEAGTAAEAVERARQLQPDLVILDLQLPDYDGWRVIREIRRVRVITKILIFSHHETSFIQRTAENAGCDGAFSKCGQPAELMEAIRIVISGGKFFGPEAYSAASR